MEVSEAELQKHAERAFNCKSKLKAAERVTETYDGRPVWDGIVHVFELIGHPKAATGYAWSSSMDDSSKRRFYTVLGVPPINSARDAVRTAIVAENKKNQA
jgi:hypothetical protein